MSKYINLPRLLLLILLFASNACNRHEYTGNSATMYPLLLKINPLEATTDTMNLSEIAHHIEYIPLETTEFSEMGYFGQDYFCATDEYFFIRNELEILKFNNKGNFLKSLFTPGNGPGEALPVCFTADDELKRIYIFNRDKSVKIFDYDGNFVKKITNYINPTESLPPYRIEFFNNNLFISNPQRPGVKYIYSCYDLFKDSIRILYKNIREYEKSQYKKWPVIILDDSNYQITDTTILFKEKYCDTIFLVDKNFNIFPRYIINLDNHKLKWEDWRVKMFDPSGGPPDGYWVQSFADSKSFLIIVLASFREPRRILVVYNKEKKSVKMSAIPYFDRNISQIFLRNDIDNLINVPVITKIYGDIIYRNEIIYCIMEGGEFASAYQKVPEKIRRVSPYLKKMKSVFNQITDFSNPIIIKVYLK